MILVTGANGFIGKHLIAALIEQMGKDHVLALTSKPIENVSYLIHDDYSFGIDFFKEKGYAELIDTIIHVGAFIPKDASTLNNVVKCNENISKLEKLLYSNLPSLKKLIFLSSIDVYGTTEQITEDSMVKPASLYGYSKAYGEEMIKCWAKEKNVKAEILRIGHVYGPGEELYQKIIPVTMRKIISNEPIEIWGDGTDLRAFIYIDDVVTAILNALYLEEEVGPINVVSGNTIDLKTLVHKMIQVSGKEIPIHFQERRVEKRNLVFENSKLKKYILPTEVDLNIGLEREWMYMKNLM